MRQLLENYQVRVSAHARACVDSRHRCKRTGTPSGANEGAAGELGPHAQNQPQIQTRGMSLYHTHTCLFLSACLYPLSLSLSPPSLCHTHTLFLCLSLSACLSRLSIFLSLCVSLSSENFQITVLTPNHVRFSIRSPDKCSKVTWQKQPINRKVHGSHKGPQILSLGPCCLSPCCVLCCDRCSRRHVTATRSESRR